MASLPPLLDAQIDPSHRCHHWIDDNQLGPPPTFRLRAVATRWDLDPRFVPYLMRSGLLPFARMTSTGRCFTLDGSLLTSLVDRWRPETHTFHFRFGEMTPTLKDVSMITGLPLRGEPLVLQPAPLTWHDDLEVRLNRQIPRLRSGKQHRGVPISWLVDFIGVPPNANEDVVRRHLIAYVLYLFGMMFPSSNGEVVHPSLIRLAVHIASTLDDDSDFLMYSLGSAVLCQTYRGLCDAALRKKPSKEPVLAVCYIFLQLWSWEYLPVGRPRIDVPVHPYQLGQVQFDCATMGSRWTYGTLAWARQLATRCYPLYHDDFERIDEIDVTWNPWRAEYISHVEGEVQLASECYRDMRLWMTRSHLLCLHMVEPHNPDRVMSQFDLFQQVPPPNPRCLEAKYHEQSNQGKKNHNWMRTQKQWILEWRNSASTNVISEQRRYDPRTYEIYMTWYLASTRSKLTRAPPERPTQRTRQEQLERGMDRETASRRDDTIARQHSIMSDVRDIVAGNHRGLPSTVKSRLVRIFQNARHTASTWGCGRADDVALQRYNMPIAFSARPSEARPSDDRLTRNTSMRQDSEAREDSRLIRTSSRSTMHQPGSSRQAPHFDTTSIQQPIFPEITPARRVDEEFVDNAGQGSRDVTSTPDHWGAEAGFNTHLQPVHPVMGQDDYLFSHTYEQTHVSYDHGDYEQPYSSYNPGPSQPQDDQDMEYDRDFFASMDNTPIGTSQIPLRQEHATEQSTPSPRHLRNRNHSPDRLTYSAHHIYKKQQHRKKK